MFININVLSVQYNLRLIRSAREETMSLAEDAIKTEREIDEVPVWGVGQKEGGYV